MQCVHVLDGGCPKGCPLSAPVMADKWGKLRRWCEEAHLVISVYFCTRKREREPKRVPMTQEFDCRNIGTWGRSKLVGKEIFLPDWEAFVTLLTG